MTSWVKTELAQPPFRGLQLFQWIWRNRVSNFSEMTNLGKSLRATLSGLAVLPTASPTRLTPATDGTVKLLVGLHDGVNVETVWIPDWGPRASSTAGH